MEELESLEAFLTDENCSKKSHASQVFWSTHAFKQTGLDGGLMRRTLVDYSAKTGATIRLLWVAMKEEQFRSILCSWLANNREYIKSNVNFDQEYAIFTSIASYLKGQVERHQLTAAMVWEHFELDMLSEFYPELMKCWDEVAAAVGIEPLT